MKASKKNLAITIYREEKWRKGEKKSSLQLKNAYKLQEIFTTVAIVSHRYERLAVLQNIFAIILL